MARTVTIHFGGKERALKYHTVTDRAAIEKYYQGRKLWPLFAEELWGSPAGTRWRDTPEIVSGDTVLVSATTGFRPDRDRFVERGSMEALAVFVWAGIRHEDPAAITLEVCFNWLQEHVEDNGGVFDILMPVLDAVYLSGALGVCIDLEAVARVRAAAEAAEEDAKGKALTSASTSQPESTTTS